MNSVLLPPSSSPVGYDPFAQGALARVAPTTEPQREIWLADRLGADASLAFNESVHMRLRGALDVAALRSALQELFARHDALRSNFGPDGETICVLDDVTLEIEERELAALDAVARERMVADRLRLAVDTPFSLENDRLFRAELLRLGPQEHILILTAHHIVCDGWSWWVLVQELGALYGKHTGVPGKELPPADSFADYALAHSEDAAAATGEDERYWLSRFSGETPVLDLPGDRPRPPRRSFASVREDYDIDGALVDGLRALGARHGCSLFATLLAGFSGLVSRLSGQQQVVIGIPAAGQALDGHDHLVGHCVNTLPLLFDVDPKRSVTDTLAQAQETLLDAIEHQRYTFGTLLRKLKLGRDPSRLPLISVMFNIDQALEQQHHALPGLDMEFGTNPRSHENFELFINAVQLQHGIRLECQYNSALFDGSTIRRWLGHWRTMLEAMVADPAQALGRLPLLSQTERWQLLEKWNDTQVAYPQGHCLHELIEAQVERTPDAIAVVVDGGETLTYAQLNARANRLARHLRTLGVGAPDARVAVCAERSAEMVVALLAVLKAGAAYVPLDPTYPADRLAYMLRDSAPSVVLTQSRLVGLLGEMACPTVLLDEAEAWASLEATNLPRASLDASHLAYVIYTSGSTGQPKGAMNEHRGIVNRLLWMQDAYGLGADDAVLQKTPFSFDVSVWEFFWTLMTGARLVMARPDGHKDPAYLADAVRRNGITTMHFVPSMLHVYLEGIDSLHDSVAGGTSLRRVICSGEALPASLATHFHNDLPGVELHNLYGPTEAAVDVTAWACLPGAVDASVPIGRPIANTRMYVLDGFGQPVPMGVAGELFIGGVQVGRGYLNREELSAARFVADPFSRDPGARMYRTGDLARWRHDGVLEYLGRNDFQVKLRGFRIELGEIEKKLEAIEGVTQAVVILREDRPGDQRLVAYVAARAGAALSPTQLAKALKSGLPEFMVPSAFVVLDAIPLSPNGKVDRKALPVPEVSAADARTRVAPRTDLERQIATAMCAVLGTQDIGVDDDFFALGGHSLLAAQLTSRLSRELGLSLSLRTLFDAPTVARLAEHIGGNNDGQVARHDPIPRRADQSRAPLSLMQERLHMLEEFNPGQLTYNTPTSYGLHGPLDVAAFGAAFRALLQRQSVLRISVAEENGEPVQVVHDDLGDDVLPLDDLTAWPKADRESEMMRRIQALIAVPFDLSRAPLFSARLFRLDPEWHVMFFMPHHFVWDGWSFDLMYSDMAELYTAQLEHRAPNLPALPVSYGDFSAWHREWVKGPEYARQLAFWREWLAPVRGRNAEAFPTDKPRTVGMSGRARSHRITVDRELTERLRRAGQSSDATMFVILLAAYFTLLHGISGQRQLVLGSPVRGRHWPEVEDLMGYFTNLLPLRMEVDPAMPFTELVRQVKAMVLDSFAHPDIRLEDLVRELALPSAGGGSMLYQSLFSFQDIRQRVVQWGNVRHERRALFHPGATEDIGLWFVEGDAGLSGALVYNADLFHDETMDRLHARYVEILRAVAEDASQPLANIAGAADLIQETADDGIAVSAAPVQPAPPAPEPAPVVAAAPVPPPVGNIAADDPRVAYLSALWSQLLEVNAGPEDNFFDLGGHSMLAVQMANRVARDTGVRIKLVRLATQTLAQVASEFPPMSPALHLDAPSSSKRGLVGNVLRLFGRATPEQKP